MTKQELRAQIDRCHAVAKQTDSYAYTFVPHEGGLVEVRVQPSGKASVTPVDANGIATDEPKRVRPWTRP
jgi:hypothetical protein